MNLHDFEFYSTPEGEIVILEGNSIPHKYQECDLKFTTAMINHILEYYPKAYDALCKTYETSKSNRQYFEYRIVHRFIRCNFKEYDSRPDIDSQGIFCFEHVSCPLRGECKYFNVICNPEFNSTLSPAEKRVMRLISRGDSLDIIAEKLFLSIHTVKKHRRNALNRIGVHSTREFMAFAQKNRIFEND